MIDFDIKYPVEELSNICAHAIVEEEDDWVRRTYVKCKLCNFTITYDVSGTLRRLSSIFTRIDNHNIVISKHTTVIGNGSAKGKIINYPIIKPPYDISNINDRIKKLLILL